MSLMEQVLFLMINIFFVLVICFRKKGFLAKCGATCEPQIQSSRPLSAIVVNLDEGV